MSSSYIAISNSFSAALSLTRWRLHQVPAKTLIIQFYLHLSTNVASRLHDLYISSTFSNCKSISEESTIINFAILWNIWFSKMFCRIRWINIFFTFHMSLFDQNITCFASSFVAMLRTTNLFFVFKNKNYCYLCRFYHECAFELLIWLIG